MSARRGADGRPLPRGGACGYSLIETMIALGMAVIIGAATFAVYNAQQRSSRKHRGSNVLQTDCNLSMDQIKQELLLAGYRGDETTSVKTFSAADAGTVTFEYFDDKAKYNDTPGQTSYDPGVPWDAQYSGHTQITYSLSGGSLQRTIKRWHKATSTYVGASTQVVANNLQALAFEFDSGDNSAIGLPASASDLDDIRNVKIKVACQSTETDSVSGKREQVELTASVQPRNVGLESNPKDTTAPSIPSGLVTWDTGSCGSLQLRWNANTETDLEGYTVYYGLAAGSYSKRARLSSSPGTAGQSKYYELADLTPTKHTDVVPATYHIVLTAYDKSGNQSGYSAEVSNNPSPSKTVEPAANLSGSANSDTSINPAAPPAPTSFTAVATAGTQNEITLSWTSSSGTVNGLDGYRLYRDDASATFTPYGTVKGEGNCIAGTAELDSAKTTLKDPNLVGCKTYYYKLVAINCDPTLPIASQNFAAATGAPTDNTAPAVPKIIARAGYGRIILSLESGTEDDFDYTKVYYNEDDVGKNTYPTMADDGSVSQGTAIPDRYPYPGTKGEGVYDNPGTQGGIDFNSKTSGDPTNSAPALSLTQEYYFLAVSYDLCGNHTIADPVAQTAGKQCSDCEAGLPCQGAPPSLSSISSAGCYGSDGIDLTWNYPYLSQADITGDYRDLAGFHVFRKEGSTWDGNLNPAYELTGGTPIWFTGFQDAGGIYAAPQEGKTYSYRVVATDCYWEQHHGKISTEWPDPLNSPDDNYAFALKTDLYLGRLSFWPFYGKPYARLWGITSTAPIAVTVYGSSYAAQQFPISEGKLNFSINAEQFQCTGATPADAFGFSVFSGCTRGYNSTTIATHATGSIVLSLPYSPPVDALTGALTDTSLDEDERFQHNIVRTKVDNSALGILNMTAVQAEWENGAVNLTSVLFGDGSTTPANTFTGTGTSGAPFSLSGATPYSKDLDIPLNMTFTNADGSGVTADSNMREDQMSVRLDWTNPSMTSSSCTMTNTRAVPLGPVVSSVSMSRPSDGTVAIVVPGNSASPTAADTTLVPGTTTVDVYANVLDTSLTGLKAVKLYYIEDDTNSDPPAPPALTGTYPTFNYTAINMVYVAGNEWRTPSASPIPAKDGKRVWFFILALDNQGNFDREPEIGRGAFEYFQQQSSVCDNTPNPPSLTGYDGDGKVTLYVAADPKNTDGSWQGDFNGYKIYRNSGSTWQLWRTIPLGSTAPIEDTTSELSTMTFSYYAVSLDLCTPTPNVSAASSVFTECIGAPTCSLSLSTTTNPMHPANNMGITLSACSHQNGTADETLYVQACSSVDCNPIRVKESSDTGSFTIDPTYVPTHSPTTQLTATTAAGATNLDLRVASTDTITVRGFDTAATSAWDTTPQSALPCSASITVTPDPCASPVTPTMGSVTAGYTGSNCSSANNNVQLTWALPAAGTYTYFRVYRCNSSAGNCTPTSTDLYADNVTTDASTTLANFQWLDTSPGGKLNNTAIRLYYKVTAVNGACSTNLKESSLSTATKVSDTCTPN